MKQLTLPIIKYGHSHVIEYKSEELEVYDSDVALYCSRWKNDDTFVLVEDNVLEEFIIGQQVQFEHPFFKFKGTVVEAWKLKKHLLVEDYPVATCLLVAQSVADDSVILICCNTTNVSSLSKKVLSEIVGDCIEDFYTNNDGFIELTEGSVITSRDFYEPNDEQEGEDQ